MQFKHKKDMELFFKLHPILMVIMVDMYSYCYEKHGIGLTITQTISTLELDKKLNRVSPAHRLGLAADLRTKDIDKKILQDLINYINNKEEYKKYHYLIYFY